MKMIATTALVTALAFAGIGNAEAQRLETRLDRARVVDVDRIVSQRPGRIMQECWNQRTSRYDGGYYRDDSGRLYRGGRDDGTAGAVIGALIGGALGNQVGDGRGRTAATVAGAVIGSRVGKDIDEDDGYRDDGYRDAGYRDGGRDGYRDGNYRDGDFNRYRTNDGIETRCRTVQTASRVRREGFEVDFVYAGREYTTFSRQHPGRSIPVEVDVRHGRRGRTVIMDVRPADQFVAQYGYDD